MSQRDKMKIDFAHGIAKAAIITKICSGYTTNTKPAQKCRTQVRSLYLQLYIWQFELGHPKVATTRGYQSKVFDTYHLDSISS